jgi:hypothetical protein
MWTNAVVIVAGGIALIGFGVAAYLKSVGGMLFFGTIVAICLIIKIIVTRYIFKRWSYHRKVVFCDDGEILYSFTEKGHNYKLDPPLSPLKKNHANITAIESLPIGNVMFQGVQHQQYGVRLVFQDGQMQPVTLNFISDDEVRVIVVQLTQALEELRSNLAQRHRQGFSAAGVGLIE